jgi:predicted AlkP superfamily pyrophosphatase or phosphodiesterase
MMANRIFFFCAALIILESPVALAEGNPAPRHVVLIVWDGMRPDFATEKYAPNLDKLARDGVRFRDHHSVYPTATDVNGAALATGCYPTRNGICANLEFHPAINPREPIDVSDPDSIKRGDDVSGGKYLSAPTFPELLRKAGKRVALVGTKSVPLLFDRHNDWTVVKMQDRPLTIFTGAPLDAMHRDELTKALGPFPDSRNATAAQRNDFATRALTEYFWRDGVPDFSLLWLSEPDLSEHNFAPGSSQALAATKAVDANLGAVLNALEKKGAREFTDVLVVSDHGFSTIRRSVDVVALLNATGFRASKEISDSAKTGDILVVGNGGSVMFYVKDHDKTVTQRLVEWLQHSDFAGVIFTREESPGTFSLRAAYLNSDGGPDVAVAFRWFDEKNKFGIPGTIDADWNRKAGEGTHATLSRYDVHNIFIAAGPDFETGESGSARAKTVDADEPSTNLDLAPTILRILAVPAAGNPDGHSVIEETRASGEANKPQLRTLQAEHKFQDGTWKQSLRVSRDFESQWIDEGNGAFEKR